MGIMKKLWEEEEIRKDEDRRLCRAIFGKEPEEMPELSPAEEFRLELEAEREKIERMKQLAIDPKADPYIRNHTAWVLDRDFGIEVQVESY